MILIVGTLWSCSCTDNGPKDKIPAKEIALLKNAIKDSPQYENDMLRRIDSVKTKLRKADTQEQSFNSTLVLSELYRQVNTDSALYYATKALQYASGGTPSMRQRSRIATVNVLSTAGIFTEATSIFNQLNEEQMDPAVKIEYWIAGRMLYSYMRSYVVGQDQYYREYTSRYLQYDDSLLSNLPESSSYRTFVLCERLVTEGHYKQAESRLNKLLKQVGPNDNLRGMAFFQLAEIKKNIGTPKEYAAYLAMAATTDVKGCVREGMALPTLADWLYQQGEMDDAFLFINFALEDAMKGNARMRTISIAKMVPMIDGAYRERINASRDELMIYFLLATFMFLITSVLIVLLYRTLKQSRDKERRLESLSKMQQKYIGNFIGICSGYAERLESFSKTVSRKLAAGQSDELQRLINSGKFTGLHGEQFNAIFDKAFTDLYPEFVDGVNNLLRPEERIEVTKTDELTPELRIYAFVRLGVDESTKIAQMLHYSVSTVYAYRNRMRNKAINRDSFDSDVTSL
ncbi:MAG: DUF6377 domain-containing protein [Muribaculum sp.]|nr:DUF6377 domain-containing protein [Muribaculum sp.]